EDGNVAVLHLLERSGEVDYARDVYVLRSAGRSLCDGRIHCRGPALWNHDSVHPSSIGSSEECAEVMRILDPVERNDETVRGFFVSKNLVELGIVLTGNHRHHALVRLGSRQTVELFPGNKAQPDALFARQVNHRLQPLIVTLACN